MPLFRAIFRSFFGAKGTTAPSALEKRIGYRFRNKELLMQALSHRSHAVSSRHDPLQSNERLEFLGDAVLGHVAGEFLYKEYPSRLEGELSRLKSLIISRKALKNAADNIGLSDALILSRSEEKTGGRDRFSINSNAFEALIAAIYLDGGFEEARAFIRRHVLALLPDIQKDEVFVNYKSRLLEKVQAGGAEGPRYAVTEETGPDHDKTFTVTVAFRGKVYGKGLGKNKKDAEQAAARDALNAIIQET